MMTMKRRPPPSVAIVIISAAFVDISYITSVPVCIYIIILLYILYNIEICKNVISVRVEHVIKILLL